METKTLGEIKILKSPESAIEWLWHFNDKKVSFKLPSDKQRWQWTTCECINFVRLVESLRHYYPELKTKYFFETWNRILISEKTFWLSYDRKKMTIKLNTAFGVRGAIYNQFLGLTGNFIEYIDSMIYQIRREMPSAVAQSIIEECKSRAIADY